MLKNSCRLCGRYAAYKKSLSIFDNPNMLWSIQSLTGLMLENAKCLPDLICMCCQTELREAVRFCDRLIKAQQQLLTALNEEELQDVSWEYRKAVMDLSEINSLKVNNTSNTAAQSSNVNEPESDEEFIVKVQQEVNEIIIEESNKQEDLMEYEIIIDDDLITQQAEAQEAKASESIQISLHNQKFAISSENNDNVASEDYILPDDRGSDEEIAVLDQVLNDDIAVTQSVVKRKPGRKRLGNLLYVCNECGNHISGRLAFELHCKRHRGDKQFECDICQDRFCTGSELKRHMRRHTGERPFACQYCARRFTDYSTRLKHERTHTNERPYVCQSCSKAFTTAYILKNHMLIHSGERAFSCEVCNKSFLRQTHLVTHCRSSAHQRKVERESH